MTGTLIILIGIGLTAIEVGLIVFSCLCCRDTVKSTLGHKKKNALLDNENQPVSSEPSYVPTAQAAYDPSQPSYVPATQPSYAPATQPSYVPATQPVYSTPATQPVYSVSAQQTYNTPATQPAYNVPYQFSYTPNYNPSNSWVSE